MDRISSMQLSLGHWKTQSRFLTALSTSAQSLSIASLQRVMHEDVSVDARDFDVAEDEDTSSGQLKIYRVCINPEIQMVPQFLSNAEVKHLRRSAKGRWKRSVVGGHYVFGDNHVSLSDRSSCTAVIHFAETPLINAIELRLADYVGLSVEHLEMLTVVRYRPGQFFSVHHDGRDRPVTVFLYLNDLPEGDEGETHFPALGLKFTPRKGCAIMWHNTHADGTEDNRVYHQGYPPRTSVKYGVNCFFNVHRVRQASGNTLGAGFL